MDLRWKVDESPEADERWVIFQLRDELRIVYIGGDRDESFSRAGHQAWENARIEQMAGWQDQPEERVESSFERRAIAVDGKACDSEFLPLLGCRWGRRCGRCVKGSGFERRWLARAWCDVGWR